MKVLSEENCLRGAGVAYPGTRFYDLGLPSTFWTGVSFRVSDLKKVEKGR